MIYQAFFTISGGNILISNVKLPFIGKCRLKLLHFQFLGSIAAQPFLLLTSPQIITKYPLLIGTQSNHNTYASTPFSVSTYGDAFVLDDVFINGILTLRTGFYTGDNLNPGISSGASHALLTFDIEYMKNK